MIHAAAWVVAGLAAFASVRGCLPAHLQFAVWCAGVGFVYTGARGRPSAHTFSISIPRTDLVAVALTTLFAFGLRAVFLDHIRFLVDERHVLEALLAMRDDPNANLLGVVNEESVFPRVYGYIALWTTHLSGGPSFTGFRLTSAIFGALTVGATYALARAMHPSRACAVVAALTLASFPAHLHLSRLALINLADSAFGVAALALMLYAHKYDSLRLFAAAGVALGLVHYFHDAGKLLFTGLVLIATLWLHRLPWRTLLTAMLIAAPVYVQIIAFGQGAAPRLAQNNLEGLYWWTLLLNPDSGAVLADLWRVQVLPAMLHLTSHPDGSGFYYGGETGLVLPFLWPFLALGAFVAVMGLLPRHRLQHSGLLLIWVLATVAGNALIVTVSWTPRFLVVMPALAILIALGGVTLVGWLPHGRLAASTVLVVMIVGGQLVYYVRVHLPAYPAQVQTGLPDDEDALYRVMDLGVETAVVVPFGPTLQRKTQVLAAYYRTPTRLTFVERAAFLQGPLRAEAYFFQPGDAAVEARLVERYGPRALRFSVYNVTEGSEYALFVVAETHLTPGR